MPIVASTGTRFDSRTTTVNWFVALSAGSPLSVTFTTTTFVEGPCASVGVQATWPVGLTVNPAGPLTRPNVSKFAGTSVSVAGKVSASGVPSSNAWFEIAASNGAAFTSRTTTTH